MKLTLSQQELEQAVRNYVTGMISLQAGTDITIDFKAGRGENGITAEVDINHLAVSAIPAVQGATLATVFAAKPEGARTTATTKAAEVVKETAAPATDSTVTDKPTETRKITGKSLFGSGDKAGATMGTIEPAAESANDSAVDGAEEVPAAAAASGGRKTLFSE